MRCPHCRGADTVHLEEAPPCAALVCYKCGWRRLQPRAPRPRWKPDMKTFRCPGCGRQVERSPRGRADRCLDCSTGQQREQDAQRKRTQRREKKARQ